MNIFIVDLHPREAARMLCDKHVCKMCIEGTQMLSTALHKWGLWREGMARPYQPNHPATKWASECWPNFIWLLMHTQELYEEYSRRYHREHESRKRFRLILDVMTERTYASGPLPHWQDHTPFVQCMPKKFQHPNPVQAYRNFYLLDKSRFARWSHTKPPVWMSETPVLLDCGVDSVHGPRRKRAPHQGDVRPFGQAGRRHVDGRRQVDCGREP